MDGPAIFIPRSETKTFTNFVETARRETRGRLSPAEVVVSSDGGSSEA